MSRLHQSESASIKQLLCLDQHLHTHQCPFLSNRITFSELLEVGPGHQGTILEVAAAGFLQDR